MSLYSKDHIYYIEYLDHMRTSESIEDLKEKPPVLWCCGKKFEEDENFLAVICSGIKDRAPNTSPTFEVIFKNAIIKDQLVYQVDPTKINKFQINNYERENSIHFVAKISKSGKKKLINIPAVKFGEIPIEYKFFKVYLIPIKF